MSVANVLCACGRALHYTDPKNQETVEKLSKELGPTVKIQVGAEVYALQRHYLALHGFRSRDLPELAKAKIAERLE